MVLILILILSLTNIGNCEILQPLYNGTGNIIVDFSLSGNSASCSGRITPNITAQTEIVVKLQKKENNTWTIIASWSSGKNNGTSEAGGTCSVESGYQYRVWATGTVSNDEGEIYETVSRYSTIISN